MDRRRFIENATTATLGAVALGPTGCAGALGSGPRPELPALSDPELEGRLARLDAGLEQLRGVSLYEDMFSVETLARRPDLRQYAERTNGMARRAMRSLLTAGTILDLPPASRSHAEVQRRLQAQSEELDESVLETTGYLAALPPDHRVQLAEVMRAQPALALDFVDAIDRRTEALGLGDASRRQLRNMGREVSFRMTRQAPSLVIDEYVGKVERIAARRGVEVSAQRWLTTAALEEVLWSPVAAGLSTTGAPGTAPNNKKNILIAGGVLTGIGTVLLVAGGLVISGSGSIAGAFMLTGGAVLLLVGLIVLLVGASKRSRPAEGADKSAPIEGADKSAPAEGADKPTE